MADRFISLTEASDHLLRTTGRAGPGWRALHALAVDAKIPAVKLRGRWGVHERDFPAVINVLGLTTDRPA